jgi:hypothetical protein
MQPKGAKLSYGVWLMSRPKTPVLGWPSWLAGRPCVTFRFRACGPVAGDGNLGLGGSQDNIPWHPFHLAGKRPLEAGKPGRDVPIAESKGGIPWAGFHKAARLCVQGFRGGKPLPGEHARSEAGILRDGFGVPLARNIACDV